MGMESFFVSVISPKMSFSNEAGTRKVLGYDNEYIRDWAECLKKETYSVEIMKSNLIIDSCIEFFYDETADNGRYLTLIGCFSCYDYAIKKMENILNTISEKTSIQPMVYIYGDLKKYDRSTFEYDIMKAYSTKYKAFKQMYNINVIVPPSDFYAYIKRQNNPIIKIINFMRKKR